MIYLFVSEPFPLSLIEEEYYVENKKSESADILYEFAQVDRNSGNSIAADMLFRRKIICIIGFAAIYKRLLSHKRTGFLCWPSDSSGIVPDDIQRI
jgi:hypothetical protein